MSTLEDFLQVLRRLAPLCDEFKKMQVVWEAVATKLPLETPYIKIMSMEARLNQLNFMFGQKTITIGELYELGLLQELMLPRQHSEWFLIWARLLFSVYQAHAVVAEVVPLT